MNINQQYPQDHSSNEQYKPPQESDFSLSTKQFEEKRSLTKKILGETLNESSPFHEQLATLIKDKPYLERYKKSLEKFKKDYDIKNIEFFGEGANGAILNLYSGDSPYVIKVSKHPDGSFTQEYKNHVKFFKIFKDNPSNIRIPEIYTPHKDQKHIIAMEKIPGKTLKYFLMKSCFSPLFEEEVDGKKLKEYPDYFIEQYIEQADRLLIAQEKKPKELINEDIVDNQALFADYNERRKTTLSKTKGFCNFLMDEIAQFDGNNPDSFSVFDDYMDHLDTTQKTHLRKQLKQFHRVCKKENFFHEDLNPGNIMIDDNNNLVIIDFGMASDRAYEQFFTQNLREFEDNMYY